MPRRASGDCAGCEIAVGQTVATNCAASRRSVSRQTSPPLRSVLYFRGGRALIDEKKEETPVDYRYWKEHGWLEPGTRYYIDAPINPVYSAIGGFMEFVMRWAIRMDWF